MGKSPFDLFPSICTKEITLRKIIPTDIDLLFDIYSNENLFCYFSNMLKKNIDTVANMITIEYRLNDRFWGQGIAIKAVSAMIDYLFNRIGINRIQAFVMPENIKLLNVLERNGFLKEGLIRQGHIWKGKGVVDLVEFSMLKSDYNK